MRKTATITLTLTCIAIAGTVLAAPRTYELPDETATLKPGTGEGYEAAENNCGTCHSADYINYQPPGKGKAFWETEVHKMIKTYGAPIEEKDAAAIVEYLAETY
ncbi:MAG: cytochrome c [Rhizobiales bacterium]|nr:cytochrome c [Hyphomicrobiales bacterium]